MKDTVWAQFDSKQLKDTVWVQFDSKQLKDYCMGKATSKITVKVHIVEGHKSVDQNPLLGHQLTRSNGRNQSRLPRRKLRSTQLKDTSQVTKNPCLVTSSALPEAKEGISRKRRQLSQEFS